MIPKLSVYHFALAALLLAPAVALSVRAAEQSSGGLTVQVRPDVLVTAPFTLTALAQPEASGSDSSWVVRFNLPIGVKIRLAENVAAELAIESAVDPAATLAGFVAGEFQTAGNSSPLLPTSRAIIRIAQSGVHQLSVPISLRGNSSFGSGSLPVRLTLRSLDGILDWTGTARLVWSPTGQ